MQLISSENSSNLPLTNQYNNETFTLDLCEVLNHHLRNEKMDVFFSFCVFLKLPVGHFVERIDKRHTFPAVQNGVDSRGILRPLKDVQLVER